jgi:D-inositol-3-phosphate glycosyltransferase
LFPPQTQAKLADFYAAADVVLVPSRSESFGLVALEAAACGTPVVAASVGGLRYVVEDGRTGFLVEGHDAAEHAERVLRVLRDPAMQAAIGAEASRRALRFTWDVTADEIGRVYDEVLHAA